MHIFLGLLVLLLKCDSVDYRTASVIVIDSRNKFYQDSISTTQTTDYTDIKNWESTLKIIGGNHFDKGLFLKVDDKLNIDDTLFVQYNHFYDVTWISN